MSTWGSRERDERGAAVVETTLCLCFVVVPLVLAIISYAYMFSFRQTLSQAASEGARAAVGAAAGATCVGDPTTFTAAACPAQYAAAKAVGSALSNYSMTCGTNNLTCTIAPPASCPQDVTHTCITVTVYYPYRAHSLLPTIPGLGFILPPDLGFTSVVEIA